MSIPLKSTVLFALFTAAAAAQAAFSLPAQHDYTSYLNTSTGSGRVYSNGDRMGISNVHQTGGTDSLTFFKFDLTGVSLASGERAYLNFYKFDRFNATNNASAASPMLVGITALTVNDVGASTSEAGVTAMSAEISPSSAPALTPVAAEGYLGISGLYSFDITDLVGQWIANPATNFGVAAHARNDFGSDRYIQILPNEGPNFFDPLLGLLPSDAPKPSLTSFLPAGSTLAAVPEPASLAAVGLVALGLLRRQRPSA